MTYNVFGGKLNLAHLQLDSRCCNCKASVAVAGQFGRVFYAGLVRPGNKVEEQVAVKTMKCMLKTLFVIFTAVSSKFRLLCNKLLSALI